MTPRVPEFDPAGLLAALARLPATPAYWVGYSGGADSTALLTAASELSDRLAAPVRALHFNHGLHPLAGEWQSHCSRYCDALGVPLHIERLDVPAQAGRSPELAARRARYAAAGRLVGPGEIYLTAHQADDRAETVFLNLMRGSGLDGLASIPELRRLGPGWVARPLLQFSRHQLQRFLTGRKVRWIEDPANRDVSPDRNYLRHELFPELEKRWPGVTGRLVRTADHARETVQALTTALGTRWGHLFLDDWTFAIVPLLNLPLPMQTLLIRQWIRDRGLAPPPRARLLQFLDQLAGTAHRGSAAELRWNDWQIKRFRDCLWLHPLPGPLPCPCRSWTDGPVLQLGDAHGAVRIEGAPTVPAALRVGPRRAGARMAEHAGGPRRAVKDLLRERAVPPWLRDAIPILYRKDEVMAVGDWLLSPSWQSWLQANRATYRWQPGDGLLAKVRASGHQPGIDPHAAVG